MRHSHHREIRSGIKGIAVGKYIRAIREPGVEAVGTGERCARLLKAGIEGWVGEDHVSDGNIIVWYRVVGFCGMVVQEW